MSRYFSLRGVAQGGNQCFNVTITTTVIVTVIFHLLLWHPITITASAVPSIQRHLPRVLGTGTWAFAPYTQMQPAGLAEVAPVAHQLPGPQHDGQLLHVGVLQGLLQGVAGRLAEAKHWRSEGLQARWLEGGSVLFLQQHTQKKKASKLKA